MTGYRLDGVKLSAPMVPDEDAPTVTMPIVGDNPSQLDWHLEEQDWQREERFTLTWTYLHLRVSASAWRVFDAPVPEPWLAVCVGPGVARFTGWYPTAEDGRAAVERHIAEQVRLILSEVTE